MSLPYARHEGSSLELRVATYFFNLAGLMNMYVQSASVILGE